MNHVLDVGTPVHGLDWLYDILSNIILPPPELVRVAAKHMREFGEANLQLMDDAVTAHLDLLKSISEDY